MIALLAALLIAQSSAGQAEPRDEIVLKILEPRPADPWTPDGGGALRSPHGVDHGLWRRGPLNRRAEVRINGRTVGGEAAGRLIEDLSSDRAVYRFQIRCGAVGDEQSVVVSRGERSRDGDVVYQVSRASFEGGWLQSYSGLETTDADGFWFR